MEAFFEADGHRFVPTELTRGPWDAAAQHAGPPAALLGRAIERCGEPGGLIGRVTFEILRPVPLEPLTVETRIARPGRSVELIEAALSGPEGELVRARAWRLRSVPVELDPAPAAEEPPPGPLGARQEPFFETGWGVGYHTAMESRFVSGAYLEPGPATVWMRMRHPLVAGEQPSGLQRVLVAADSGNGVSAALDWRRFLFINTDLSVHLLREPAGEWICLDARTHLDPGGTGLADTALYDEHGPIGRGAQTLLVRSRAVPPRASG